MKLSRSFYLCDDVVQIAKDLIGKTLLTTFDGNLTGGIIIETEAYAGIGDRASHAYSGRRTHRTEVMYYRGGTAYIYLCYGMHALFNVVTGPEEVPDAVLIRGIKPTIGIDFIYKRLQKNKIDNGMISGPGRVSKALGIKVSYTGTDLLGNTIWLEDNDMKINPITISVTARIGIDYAGADAFLPYRFVLE